MYGSDCACVKTQGDSHAVGFTQLLHRQKNRRTRRKVIANLGSAVNSQLQRDLCECVCACLCSCVLCLGSDVAVFDLLSLVALAPACYGFQHWKMNSNLNQFRPAYIIVYLNHIGGFYDTHKHTHRGTHMEFHHGEAMTLIIPFLSKFY